MAEKIPLVSVIIPMYNAAKFITQTLECLLYQSMKDFEVVVADDCSTDNSIEVVQNFASNFGGRLKIIKLPKNTGTPDIPRNEAIKVADGKYVTFLDDDDFFTPPALEELSTLAEEFQADVVHTDEFFAFDSTGKNFSSFEDLVSNETFTVKTCRKANSQPLQQATEISADISERMNESSFGSTTNFNGQLGRYFSEKIFGLPTS